MVDIASVSTAHWRYVQAVALAAIGMSLLAKGFWFGFPNSRGLVRERDALGWMHGFRLAVVGLCLVGIAAAWVWQAPWLFVVSVGILGEELVETSVIIEVLKRNPAPARLRAARSAAPQRLAVPRA